MDINVATQPIRTQRDLFKQWQEVSNLVPAQRRSLLVMLLKIDGTVSERVVCIDQLPLRPDADRAAHVAMTIADLCSSTSDVVGALLLLRQAGSFGQTTFEEAWADILSFELEPYLKWPICVEHSGRVRLAPTWSCAA